MSYDERRAGPGGPSGIRRMMPMLTDVAADEVCHAADGSITAVQIKQASGASDRVRRQLHELLTDCPDCAGHDWPLQRDLRASDLTALVTTNMISVGIDLATITAKVVVVIDDIEPHLNMGDLLRLLTPAPGVEYLVATHTQDDHVSGLRFDRPDVEPGHGGRLTGLLTHWARLSHDGGQPAASDAELTSWLTRRVAVGAARCAVRAAYQTRQAMVQDPVASEPVLARFAEQWLGLRPTRDTIAATGNALLQAPLDGAHPGGDHVAIQDLPSQVRAQRRAWRLLGETQLFGRPLDSLDRPLTNNRSDGAWTVADIVGGGMPPYSVDGWDDPRLGRVLARLHPEELQVAIAKANDGITWTAAALACGRTAAFGERVRCKLKRIGADLTARIQATTPRPHTA